ncbi:hypothetical protein AB0D15_20660, partial [Streptomyces sp. NPDC048551]
AAAQGLSRAAGVDTELKWPNDLLVAVEGEERTSPTPTATAGPSSRPPHAHRRPPAEPLTGVLDAPAFDLRVG